MRAALRITVLAFTVSVVVTFAGRVAAQPRAAATAAAAEPTREEARLRDLSRENARLWAENRALRQRLSELRDRQARVDPAPVPNAVPPRVVPPPPAPTPYAPTAPNGGRVPESWVPGEINGLRFYIIPLTPRLI
jgi:hypothetical protein